MVLSEEIEQIDLKQTPPPPHMNGNKIETDIKMDLSETLKPKESIKLHRDVTKLQREEMECIESNRRKDSETAHIIEEIIEGISLQQRRGTLVRTISAVLRYKKEYMNVCVCAYRPLYRIASVQ